MISLLPQTITCPACMRKGCDKCNQSGVVIDSVIPEIIKMYVPDRNKMVEASERIFKHIDTKLNDAYARGHKDGQAVNEQDKK